MDTLDIPRLVLAGVSSGVGKTTATVGLCRALRARGLKVALFKCGPDYLDPTYHQRASPTGDEGSTAEMAKWLAAPVALLVDASGMARSVAALVAGFAGFDPALQLAAVVTNRVGSRGHLELLRKALPVPPILGAFPKADQHAFASRHLGLRTADRQAVPDALFEAWGALVTEWWNLDALLALARAAPPLAVETPTPSPVTLSHCRIGLAFDEAFHFYYQDNLARLASLGAELVRFSPIHDQRLPDVGGLYLGGGYPEVHAPALAANGPMLADLRAFARQGKPVYAECGGLMYLSEGIRTLDGERHAMAGLLPGEAVMSDKLEALGYVEVETQAATCLGGAGLRFRGHQFRYSSLATTGGERVYSVRKRRGGETFAEGYRAGNVVASYVHAHWASNPLVAEGFVHSCAKGRQV